jgi:hypothetical protein
LLHNAGTPPRDLRLEPLERLVGLVVLHESFPYMDELRSELDEVRAGEGDLVGDDEREWVRLERFVFWAAFVIRKLAEANKLSDELEGKRFEIERFPRIDRSRLQDFLNWDTIEKFYDLSLSTKQEQDVLWLCNQLIHSFFFLPEIDDDRALTALYFNSDRSRREWLFRIDWQEFTRLVELVAEDDILSISYDRRSGSLRKSREPREEGGGH